MVKVREQRDIEALVVWALRDQGLGWAGKERSVLDFSDYGTVIDDDHHSGSHPNIGLWSDDDAMQIKLAIEQLPREAGSLLIQYGRAGLRPDWCEDGYGSYQQLRYGKRLMWDWSDPVNRTGTKSPRMGWVGEQRETVDFQRKQYVVWWQGLADIVGPLNETMERHQAVAPAVHREPWLAAKPVVFDADGGVIDMETAPPKVSVASIEELRYLANTPVRSTANDWGTPAVPIERKKAR